MMHGSDAGQVDTSNPDSGTCGRGREGGADHVCARPFGEREKVHCRAGWSGGFRRTTASRATADVRRVAARLAIVPVVQW